MKSKNTDKCPPTLWEKVVHVREQRGCFWASRGGPLESQSSISTQPYFAHCDDRRKDNTGGNSMAGLLFV